MTAICHIASVALIALQFGINVARGAIGIFRARRIA
jgi:hypothetical protein